MTALHLFLFETVLVSLIIILLHRLKIFFGTGLLFIYLGAVQFFQTVLASSIYNNIFGNHVVSPGSSILFTSTLFSILLLFHTDVIMKSRTVIYGLLFSNIILTILSIITSEQLAIDNNSVHIDFLKSIMNFDVTLFMVGTCLLFIDTMSLIIIYQFLNLKAKWLPLFLRIFIPLSLISTLDSAVFYNINFFSLENSDNLLTSSLVGKQITVVIFSIIGYLYLKITKQEENLSKPKNLSDTIAIFTFK